MVRLSRRDSLAAVLAAAATLTAGRAGHAEEPDIIIGNPNALTGFLGEDALRGTWGLLLAAAAVNDRGGIRALGGARLKVIPADTTSDNPAQGASVTRRLLDAEHAVMLYGCVASAVTLSAQIEAEKSRVPLLTGSYSDALVERGMKYTFKLTKKASLLSNAALDATVQMLKGAGAPIASVAICTSSTAVDAIISKTLPIEAKRIGLSVPVAIGFQSGLADPSAVVQPILQNRPDLIVLSAGLQDSVLILQALRGVGIRTPVLTGGGMANDAAGAALGAATADMFMNVHWNWDLQTPRSAELLAAYRRAYPREPKQPDNEQLGLGYAAGLIMAEALEKAASRDGDRLREVLLSTDFTDLPLPPGKVAFDDTGYNKYAQIIVVEWVTPLETRTVWPADLSTVKPAL